MFHALLWAAAGTGFTFAVTTLGAATVFLFRRTPSLALHRIMLGFAAGVMIAASVWSLLIPAIDQAEALGFPSWVPAACGSVLGIAFLLAMDTLLPHLSPDTVHLARGDDARRRTALLVLAVTLHNIPEGMAVGVSFALAAQGEDPVLFTAATALALGIGIQNFPEGAAISLPLRQEGYSRAKSFLLGTLSGSVEPIFGMLVVLAASGVRPLMPWLLSFAAGAMLYVVVEELVPQAHSKTGTCGFVGGFLIMMILDVALG